MSQTYYLNHFRPSSGCSRWRFRQSHSFHRLHAACCYSGRGIRPAAHDYCFWQSRSGPSNSTLIISDHDRRMFVCAGRVIRHHQFRGCGWSRDSDDSVLVNARCRQHGNNGRAQKNADGFHMFAFLLFLAHQEACSMECYSISQC